jgi:methylphosphotriester-DNA--protein-cysteine methyltransferase
VRRGAAARARFLFADPAAARAAGFRPCKRCRPEGLPRELEIVDRACAVLDAHPERLTLQQLSDAVHLSPFHLQRLFKRVVGVSPRQYQAAQRGAALRDALQSGQPVTQAAVDAGFNSPSRLYASVPRELGMAPSAFRRQGAGLRIDYASAATPLGMVLVAATAQGICRIAFGDEAAPLVAELKLAFARAELVEAPSRVAPFVAQIRAYLDGTRHTFDLPLDIAPTAFQQRVWRRSRISRTAKRAAIRTSPKRSARRARCAPWRRPARRTRSRSRFHVIVSCRRAARSPDIGGACVARRRCWRPRRAMRVPMKPRPSRRATQFEHRTDHARGERVR